MFRGLLGSRGLLEVCWRWEVCWTSQLEPSANDISKNKNKEPDLFKILRKKRKNRKKKRKDRKNGVISKRSEDIMFRECCLGTILSYSLLISNV